MVTHNGFVYVGLGSGSNGNLNDWWAYDIETDSWTQKTDFPSFERHHPYQFAIGDYVYVGFGHGNVGAQIYREWYQYDPVNDSWTQVSDIPGQGRVAGTQFSHGGFGYILSGDGDDHSAMPNGEFWKYDGDEDTWEELESHPGQSRWAPASFVLNNEVYLFNGSTSFTNYPDESYKFSLQVPSGLEDVELNENAVQVYPNPFDDQLRLDIGREVIDDFSNATIQVRNLLGQIIVETNLISGSEEINLEELAVGVYHLNVFDGETKIAAKKIVRIK